MKEECISCYSTENLIEEGGQFCGGTWYLCGGCYLEQEESSRKLQEIIENFSKKTLKEKR